MALDTPYLEAIKGFEGYAPAASWDYKQYSSGYGTRAQPGDESIPPEQLKAIHEQRFANEVGNAAASVDSFNPNLPPGVRAALTSLTYNAGPGWQQSSLGDAIKSGDYNKAREIFLQYNKAGGEVNPGLVARRQNEAAWFGGQMPVTGLAAPAGAARPSRVPLLPQQTPIFPETPQAQSQQQTPVGGGVFGQIPAEQGIQMFPIQFPPPRRMPDLSKLRAAFKAPILYRG